MSETNPTNRPANQPVATTPAAATEPSPAPVPASAPVEVATPEVNTVIEYRQNDKKIDAPLTITSRRFLRRGHNGTARVPACVITGPANRFKPQVGDEVSVTENGQTLRFNVDSETGIVVEGDSVSVIAVLVEKTPAE